jgi:hypothetical protein
MPNPILEELWRDVTRRRGYQVSSWGRVRSSKALYGKSDDGYYYLKLTPGSDGYHNVDLFEDRSHHYVNVHMLVLEAFVGPCPPGLQCRHLDGNPGNNRLDNLKWGTAKENADDRQSHGRTYHGSEHHRALVDEQQVLLIRQRYAGGELAVDLASEFGLSYPALHNILDGKSWQHVQMIQKRKRRGVRGSRNSQSKLDETKVREIKRRLAEGETGASIARSLGVAEPTIADIKNGRSWTHIK